jgi:hypothetical protein
VGQINLEMKVFWILTYPLRSPDASLLARIDYHQTDYSWASPFAYVFHLNLRSGLLLGNFLVRIT